MYLFHSVQFVVFAAVAFALYWALPGRFRNLLLLAASWAFYASWDWRFVGLLAGSAALDYACARAIAASADAGARRRWLWLSLAANFGVLVFFKLGSLFAQAFGALLAAARPASTVSVWEFVLPLGLSFYTLQKVGYVVDVYRRETEPSRAPVDFLLFVSYFPQLIAGPIGRARDLLPQFAAPKTLAGVAWREGVYLYVWGLFKKVVLADSVGRIADAVFGPGTSPPTGAETLLGLYAYAVQLYCDFSGYSDMARGLSHFFGIRLAVNFDTPFFSKNFFDFYRRWHISLCTWIADYVYMPLFFRLPSTAPFRRLASNGARLFWSAAVAILVTRLLFALWHGATLNFLLFGVYLYVAQMGTGLLRPLARRVPWPEGGAFRGALEAGRVVLTFHLFCLAMLFFRGADLGQTVALARALLSGVDPAGLLRPDFWYLYASMAFLGVYEFLQYRRGDQLFLCRSGFYAQLAFYVTLLLFYLNVGAMADRRFLYFQF
jgi:D-alanyl-lipoteichoic acid acyltransferase DltB (MBOAT superfamily)